jgi:hypothetical protein
MLSGNPSGTSIPAALQSEKQAKYNIIDNKAGANRRVDFMKVLYGKKVFMVIVIRTAFPRNIGGSTICLQVKTGKSPIQHFIDDPLEKNPFDRPDNLSIMVFKIRIL